jgi:hypothetical protein
MEYFILTFITCEPQAASGLLGADWQEINK